LFLFLFLFLLLFLLLFFVHSFIHLFIHSFTLIHSHSFILRKPTSGHLLHNDRHIRGYSERTCTPLHPEDGRFDPTSCTSFDSP
jgi:hypothetical protein